MADLGVVVVTYNALPWIRQCLESVSAYPTVVVDHGSVDETVATVSRDFPNVTLIEQENRGLCAGWNRGVAELPPARWYLILNADAWASGDAVEKLVAFGDAHPKAAVVGPLLRYPDGRLQRSVRAFPTLWRLATEYLFIRKLAPRSRLANSFYVGYFDHKSVIEVEWLMGAVLLVRGDAIADVGGCDEGFFLFCEETDWCYRFKQAGWQVWFTPEAEFVHVGGASHGGRMYVENVRGHLRFLWKHRGVREAERARRLLLAALRVRGVLFRGDRGRMYREAARWLASAPAAALVERR